MTGAGFVLGTAQLGMPYGRTNDLPPPPPEECVAIVRTAVEAGAGWLDTARAYGESERRIGPALRGGWADRVRVATKLHPLDGVPDDASDGAVRDAVDASVFRSCRELGLPALDTLLLHRAHHRTSHGGRVWARLRELRDDGVVGRLGISVQTVDEARAALADGEVKHVQLPFNLLDWRWREGGIDRMAADRPDVTVHARSALLQGLLASTSSGPWPVLAEPYRPGEIVDTLARLARELGREGAPELCLAHVRAQPWIHGVVVGVASRGQLLENLRAWESPPLPAAACAAVEAAVGRVPAALLNPALWPPRQG
jgi:aryl-alcohol dehydrogenase-like predicted oxidoreductase